MAAALSLGCFSGLPAPAQAADHSGSADAEQRANRLVMLLNAAAIISFGVWWWRGRRRRQEVLPGQVTTETNVPRPHTDALSRFPEEVPSEIARRVAGEFRTGSATSQAQAAREMAELEGRLARIHAPLEERLRAYECRISELEHALAAQRAENRGLLEAGIQLAREKLAAEREAAPCPSPPIGRKPEDDAPR